LLNAAESDNATTAPIPRLLGGRRNVIVSDEMLDRTHW
jgi:hypothetical protein